MKTPLNLRNSIYQQRASGSFSGLTVNDGMLINNRPDGKTGIAQAVEVKKQIKQAEKVSNMASSFAMGKAMSDMGGCCD